MAKDVSIHIDILSGSAIAVLDGVPELLLAAGPGGGFQGVMPKATAVEPPKAKQNAVTYNGPSILPAEVVGALIAQLSGIANPPNDAAHPFALYLQGVLVGYSRNKFCDRAKALLMSGYPPQLLTVLDTRDGAVFSIAEALQG